MKALPIIIDTNLLLLFVVGTASRKYISKHKRLTEFVEEDFDMLLKMISKAPAVLVTPNTLTETSNLAAFIGEPARTEIFRILRQVVLSSEETYVPSHVASAKSEFIRLGLTDAALLEVSSAETVLVTTDLKLFLAVQATGALAINFNQLRDSYLGV